MLDKYRPETAGYKDHDGKAHDTEEDAYRANLMRCLRLNWESYSQTPMVDNIVTWATNTINLEVLTELHRLDEGGEVLDTEVTEEWVTFGRQVALARGVTGMTTEELATAARVSASTVRRIENGTQSPGIKTSLALAAALDTTLDDMMNGNLPASTPDLAF